MPKIKNKKSERIKICALGGKLPGKSTFIYKFMNNCSFEDIFKEDLESTKNLTINGKNYSVFITDTAGQERCRSISLSYVKRSDGILLFYDITDQQTFNDIPSWINDIYLIKDIPIVIIANKCDLEDKRVILKNEGEELSKRYKLSFFETSCKDGINIQESVLELIRQIIEKKENKKIEIKDYQIFEKKENKKIEIKDFQIIENDFEDKNLEKIVEDKNIINKEKTKRINNLFKLYNNNKLSKYISN